MYSSQIFTMLLGFIILYVGYYFHKYQQLKLICIVKYFQVLLNARLGFAMISDNKFLIGSYTKEEIESISKVIINEMGFVLLIMKIAVLHKKRSVCIQHRCSGVSFVAK